MPALKTVSSEAYENDAGDLSLSTAFAETVGSGEPLHLKLRYAITRLLVTGAWGAGDKLPAERDIADEVKLSLGTVQKTLNALATEGLLVRRHGHGTFVAGDASQASTLAHFRFEGDDGSSIAPVYAEAIDRRIVREHGPWAGFLTDSEEALLITRRISVADEFDCISDFYLDAGRFKSIMDMPMEKLHRTVIRKFIGHAFDAPTLSASQTVAASLFPERIRELMLMGEVDAIGLVLTVRSLTHGARPLSFQQIYIPSTARPLELPNARFT